MSVLDRVRHGAKWLLLSVYGPAEQDRPVDPIENLDREEDDEPDRP